MKETLMKDPLTIGGHEFQSRFILGSGKFSSGINQSRDRTWRSGNCHACTKKSEHGRRRKYFRLYS